MNQCHFLGNLTHEPEIKTTKNDKQVVNFSVAVNTQWGGERKPTFVNCEAWNKTAELVARHFAKGDAIIVHGPLRQDTWEKDGEKKSKFVLLVNSIDFPPRKKEADAGEGDGGEAPARRPAAKPAGKPAKGRKAAEAYPDDDAPAVGEDQIPF